MAEFYQGRNLVFQTKAPSMPELNLKIKRAMAVIPELGDTKVVPNIQISCGPDPARDMQQIFGMTNLNRKQFSKRYGVEYRTFLTWLHGERDPGEFTRRLLYFRVLNDEFKDLF